MHYTFRRVPINCENWLLVLSVCPSEWKSSAVTRRIFMKFDVLSIFRDSIEKFQVSLKSDKHNGWRPENFLHHWVWRWEVCKKKTQSKTNVTTGYELSVAVTVESAVSWDVTSCILVYVYRCFRETCYLCSQGRSMLYSGEETPIFIRNGGAWAPEPLWRRGDKSNIFSSRNITPILRSSILWSLFVDAEVYITYMRRLTTGIPSEKCVVRRFRRCANVIECTYTNLDSIACYTPRLYGITYCS